MRTIEKFGLGFIVVLGLTTLMLPDRQTPRVIDAIGNLWQKASNSAIARGPVS